VDHLKPSERGFLGGRQVTTSFLQRIPFGEKHFRKLLFLLPSAIESLDLSGFDVVLSSSHAVAKGILTGPEQLHLCYCHSPMRYAWDQQHEYLRQAGLTRGLKSLYARSMLHYLRLWDVRTTHGVDHFVANSSFIARRIEKIYRRQSTVIHPPVDTESFQLERCKEDFYFAAARFVPYKRLDLIVQAFALSPSKKLVIAGDGPLLKHCKRLATPNVEFVGYQSDAGLRNLMQRARAFVFAAEEDFGITVVEAQACGTPVICYRRGGVLDTVIPGCTGLFFPEQTPESLASVLDQFEKIEGSFEPERIRANAERFRASEFRRRFSELFTTQFLLRQDNYKLSLPGPEFAKSAAASSLR
jgi:hypothetical protein